MKIFCSALIAAVFAADVHASVIPVGEEAQRFVPMISQLFAFTPVSRSDDADGGSDPAGDDNEVEDVSDDCNTDCEAATAELSTATAVKTAAVEAVEAAKQDVAAKKTALADAEIATSTAKIVLNTSQSNVRKAKAAQKTSPSE